MCRSIKSEGEKENVSVFIEISQRFWKLFVLFIFVNN